MASILCSQGVVLATAMAVSGTVILLAFRLQKSLPLDHPSRQVVLRPCISSEGKKRKSKKKRVHFAKDVVDPSGSGEEFRRQHGGAIIVAKKKSGGGDVKEMPANRVALYNGILRDRNRLAYSC